MPKKAKKKPLRAVTAVKALARERIGQPPARRIAPDRRKKKTSDKHKPTLGRLLAEEG